MSEVTELTTDADILPKPLANYVIIANPIYGKTDSMEGDMAKLAPKEREEFMKHNLYDIWQDSLILGVGDGVVGLVEGDRAITTPTLAASGVVILKEKYLMIRESSFIGKW